MQGYKGIKQKRVTIFSPYLPIVYYYAKKYLCPLKTTWQTVFPCLPKSLYIMLTAILPNYLYNISLVNKNISLFEFNKPLLFFRLILISI